jgi:hypothetical protein
MEAKESTDIEYVRPTEGESSLTTAVLRFRHSAAGSGISRSRHIRPGGLLRVEYDPARLPPEFGCARRDSRDCVPRAFPPTWRAL